MSRYLKLGNPPNWKMDKNPCKVFIHILVKGYLLDEEGSDMYQVT